MFVFLALCLSQSHAAIKDAHGYASGFFATKGPSIFESPEHEVAFLTNKPGRVLTKSEVLEQTPIWSEALEQKRTSIEDKTYPSLIELLDLFEIRERDINAYKLRDDRQYSEVKRRDSRLYKWNRENAFGAVDIERRISEVCDGIKWYFISKILDTGKSCNIIAMHGVDFVSDDAMKRIISKALEDLQTVYPSCRFHMEMGVASPDVLWFKYDFDPLTY
jgi:hypothetical protein